MKLYSRESGKISKWWLSLDHNIIFSFVLILLCGVMMSLSSSPYVAERIGLGASYFYSKHIIFVVLCLAVAIFFSTLDSTLILRFSLLGLLIFLFLVFVVLLTEGQLKGAKRWLKIFGFSMQPSEFLKPFFIVINAWFLTRKFVRSDFNGYAISVALFGLVITGLVLQPDIGMTLSFSAVWAAQIFLSGIPFYVILILLFIGIGGIVSAYFIFGHVRYRIDMFLFSDGSPTYQVRKSLEAIDSGGLLGTGIFEGKVKMVLPDSHTDFVFAVMMEELGILVTFAVLFLYFFMIFRIFVNIKYAQNNFTKVLLVGIAVQIAFQVFVNVGVNMNLLPTKGTTLPLISYGGSSMLAMGILVGILLAFCKDQYGMLKKKL